MHCIIGPVARESNAFGGRRPSEDGVACGPEGGLEARQWNWGSAGAIAQEAEGGPDSGPPETLSQSRSIDKNEVPATAGVVPSLLSSCFVSFAICSQKRHSSQWIQLPVVRGSLGAAPAKALRLHRENRRGAILPVDLEG
jgi:hypothetical protein